MLFSSGHAKSFWLPEGPWQEGWKSNSPWETTRTSPSRSYDWRHSKMQKCISSRSFLKLFVRVQTVWISYFPWAETKKKPSMSIMHGTWAVFHPPLGCCKHPRNPSLVSFKISWTSAQCSRTCDNWRLGQALSTYGASKVRTFPQRWTCFLFTKEHLK